LLPVNLDVVFPEGDTPTIVPDPDVTLKIEYDNVVVSLRVLVKLFSATGSGEVHGSGEFIVDPSSGPAGNTFFVAPFAGGTVGDVVVVRLMAYLVTDDPISSTPLAGSISVVYLGATTTLTTATVTTSTVNRHVRR
jgi:hypothetical protein